MNKLLILLPFVLSLNLSGSSDQSEFNVKNYGAVGDGVADDWQAFNDAINAMTGPAPAYGRVLTVPPGIYKLSKTLFIDKVVRIQGVGSSKADGYNPSVIRCEPNITCINFRMSNQPSPRSTGSVIERLRIEPRVKGTVGHGLLIESRVHVRDVFIKNFGEDCIRINGNVFGDVYTNTNLWEVSQSQLYYCGGHGLHVFGNDSNQGISTGIDSSYNGGWGIYDHSFLGNLYIAPHTSYNTLGSIKTEGGVNGTTILHPYKEGSELSQFSALTYIFGGNLGAFTGGRSIAGMGSQITLRGMHPAYGVTPTLQLQAYLGQVMPHFRLISSSGTTQALWNTKGYLGLGFPPSREPGFPNAGSATGQLDLWEVSPSIRWGIFDPATGGVYGWAGQVRAVKEGTSAFDKSRLTFETPDTAGTALPSLTITKGKVVVGGTSITPGANFEVQGLGGFMPPRLTTVQIEALGCDAAREGLTVWNKDIKRLESCDGLVWR